MECYEKLITMATILECCNLLQCAASIAVAKGSGRIALLEPDGYARVYRVLVNGENTVCVEEVGLAEERAIGSGDVVATKERIPADYWLELQQRGVVALVMPPPSGCRRRKHPRRKS